MQTKSIHDYVVFSNQDENLINEENLETILDVESLKDKEAQGTTRNVRKSIEHFLERQRLRNELVDFDFYEEH